MQSNTAEKYYQLTNQPKASGIGSLLTTVSDRKLEVEDGSSGTIAYYTADACAEQSRSIISSSDYYPFGFAMDGRDYESNSYRFGFNGQEKDDEVTGSTSHYDFGARIYDSRIGRFLSVDPMADKFPNESAYIFAGNNAIYNIDFNGEYKLSKSFKENYPHFTKYLCTQIIEDVKNSGPLESALMKYGQYETKEQLYGDLSDNNGPELIPKEIVGDFFPNAMGGVQKDKPEELQLKIELIQNYEDVMNNESSTKKEKQAALLALTSTLYHETIHHQDLENDGIDNGPDFAKEINGEITGELGDIFEYEVYYHNFDGTVDERNEQAKSVIYKLNHDSSAKTALPTVPSQDSSTKAESTEKNNNKK